MQKSKKHTVSLQSSIFTYNSDGYKYDLKPTFLEMTVSGNVGDKNCLMTLKGRKQR